MDSQLVTLQNISINLTTKGQGQTQHEYSLQSAGYLSVILSALFFLQFFWRTRQEIKSDKREDGSVGMDVIPCPKPFFIKYIGCAFQFLPLKETLNKTLAWHKLYGSCMRVAAANYHGILVYSAPLAQCFLKSGDFGHVSKAGMPFYDIMRPFLGNGLLISEGSYWQKHRKILMRSMTFQSLRNYTKLLNKHSRRFVDSLEKLYADNGEHPFNVQINSSFLAIITEILTGSDIKDMTQVAEYHHHFQKWKECLLARIEKPWFLLDLLWKFHPMSRDHDNAITHMNAFAIQRLQEHKERRELLAKTESTDLQSSEEFRCTLDEMMDAGVSDEEIVHEINTLLFGGHETTATTIHFFFFLMALHPEYQELCRKEIDQVFEDPSQVSDGNLSFEVMNNLKNVERCLFETMRLLPVAFGFMRNLKTSLTIEYEGQNVHVPAGTCILITPWVIHRNEEDYPEPEKFDPDRFLPEECAKRHPYAYLPFSAGPRNCIGLKFGMNEMKTVAAYVLRNFELSTSDRLEDVALLPNITLTPERDYNFRLKRRAH
ncbi:Cytochrome P450 4C1 [Orchesella cincta]|uniref:Cytochrome P450 4C1 n=1 Tax=Orchesella cincta TaxID=48709 RepID=A0A1D2NIZ2_ORCCI|nr:Cytochrome P450 4C1 [Orchesella cincta]